MRYGCPRDRPLILAKWSVDRKYPVGRHSVVERRGCGGLFSLHTLRDILRASSIAKGLPRPRNKNRTMSPGRA